MSNPTSQSAPKSSQMVLSAEQQHVMKLVEARENVFFTGPAGTGKSVLLKKIIEHLNYRENTIAITASTGLAGLNIGGTTLHSFAGIGLGKEPVDQLVTNIKKNIKLVKRWQYKETLIIDEISMIDASLFDKLEYIARKIRKKEAPFGGLQLIITGDFFQLPPVPDHSFNHGKTISRFAFEAKSWLTCIARPIFLTQVFRQKDDAFIQILTNMRRGMPTPEDVRRLKSLARTVQYPDDIEPCQLFPLRQEVEACNRSRLESLPDPQHIFYAMDSAGYDIDGIPIPKDDAKTLLERVAAPAIVLLKLGAQVMLVQNLKEPSNLVNGSTGKVAEFLSLQDADARGIQRAEVAGRSNSDSDISGVIILTQENHCRPLTGHVFSRHQVWPVVRFSKEANDQLVIFLPMEFTIQGFKSNVEARRIQVPLVLAWALSIHKSQGQTLDRVKVDLGRIFEKGQAYVAISRATSMAGLEIENFEPSTVMAHPRVIQWHRCWTEPNGSEELEVEFDEQ